MREQTPEATRQPTIVDFTSDVERRELVAAMVAAIRQMNAEAAKRNLVKAFRSAA